MKKKSEENKEKSTKKKTNKIERGNNMKKLAIFSIIAFLLAFAFVVEFLPASVEAGCLVLSVDTHLPEIPDVVFYRLYARIRLTKLGRGFGVRGMKGFLAEWDGSGRMTIRIPSYTEIWNIPDWAFQIQAQCILLDSRTGFRSQYQRAIQVIKASSPDLPTV